MIAGPSAARRELFRAHDGFRGGAANSGLEFEESPAEDTENAELDEEKRLLSSFLSRGLCALRGAILRFVGPPGSITSLISLTRTDVRLYL